MLTVMGAGYLMYGLIETSLEIEKVERSDVTLALSSSLYDPPPLAPWEGGGEGGRGREEEEGGGGGRRRGEGGRWVG